MKNVATEVEPIKAPVHLDSESAVHVSKIIVYFYEEKEFVFFFLIVVTLGCGDSAAENNTYIEQSSTTSLSTNPCKYNICPCQSNICRIRYDFSTFEIASAPTQTIANPATNGVDSKLFFSFLNHLYVSNCMPSNFQMELFQLANVLLMLSTSLLLEILAPPQFVGQTLDITVNQQSQIKFVKQFSHNVLFFLHLQ